MKVLVACEFSGVVREAFSAKGHFAMSCDLLPTEIPGEHYQGDVRDVLDERWDLMIAHPPCTHLAVSGARHFGRKATEQRLALEFVKLLMNAPIRHICIENPVSVISSAIREPDQIIQPWQFGHGETKATCLWLKNLPLLRPTRPVEGREQRIHLMSPSPERWRERSRTYTGIAEAMAEQWGTKPLAYQMELFEGGGLSREVTMLTGVEDEVWYTSQATEELVTDGAFASITPNRISFARTDEVRVLMAGSATDSSVARERGPGRTRRHILGGVG